MIRDAIVKDLQTLIGEKKIVTDEAVLRENSHDRYTKYANVFGIFTFPLPVAVVLPETAEEVSKILSYGNEKGINGVPRTGGSATEGGLETRIENSIVIDGSRMDKIIKIDPYNMQATAQCGVNLEVLENKAREKGLTIGHSPQSKPLAQMGGLVATRSIGQFSTLYGGIEDMVVGLEAVFPNGQISRIKNVPRRACGPDIRHIIIGNEGALCYITEVTVKLHKYRPENNAFDTWALDNMGTGFQILQRVMTEGYRPSIARLYDVQDGAQHGFDQFAPDKCVVLFMSEGPKGIAKVTSEGIRKIVTEFQEAIPIDAKIIETWFNNLCWGPEKIIEEREMIRKTHNMGFTTEVSGNWDCINTIYEKAISRIMAEFPHTKDLTMLGGHSSHSYQTGTNMYFVYDYNVVDCKPEDEMEKYHIPLNAMIVEETLKAGGAMVHHHGIGKYRTPWTKAEHGSAYYILKSLKDVYDPKGIMNKGTIFPDEDQN